MDVFDDLIPQPPQAAPLNPFEDLIPKGDGVVLNATAGVNESIAGTLGVLVDAATWLVNRGIDGISAVVGAELPLVQKPVGGADWWKDRMGDIGADPRNVQAVTDTEKAVRGGARGATDAITMVVPGAALATYAKAGSTAGSVGKTLAAQPVIQIAASTIGGTVSEVTDSPLTGLMAALAVPLLGAGAGRVVHPVRSTLGPEEARLAQVAQQEGIALTPAQKTGSRPLQAIESSFSTMPFTAGPQARVNSGQQQAFTRAALRRAGIEADAATPNVMQAAAKRLGDDFDAITGRINIQVDDDLLKALDVVELRYARKLPSQTREIVANYLADIRGAGPAIPGDTYKITRSDLRNQANSFRNSDSFTAQALKDIRKALDAAADRSVPPNLRDAWKRVNREYANYKVIDKALSNTTDAATGGYIPPAALANAARTGAPGQYAQGGGDLNDLAGAGLKFLRDPVPNPGTPERTIMQRMLTGDGVAGAAAGAGVGATFATGDPSLLAATAAGLLAPRAVQSLYYKRPVQAYLAQSGGLLGPRVTPALLSNITASQTKGLLGN